MHLNGFLNNNVYFYISINRIINKQPIMKNRFLIAAFAVAALFTSCGPKALVPAEKGGFETGKYRNVFVEAGYSKKAVDAKLNEVFE